MYSIVWADAWDHELDEMRGAGRCLADGLAELPLAERIAGVWATLAWRVYGPGVVAVLDAGHRSVRVLPCRRAVAPARYAPC